ncbi:MAG: rod shape-determining protein RodA [Lachnospiraceae bacterium]|nr:rod shape-determining protein RodA [Lachnospiraceae bacterium]
MLKTYQLRNYNFTLVVLVLLLSTMGVIFINIADPSFTAKQILGIVIGLSVMVFFSLFDYNTLCKFWWVIYIVNCIVLLMVKLVGYEVNGAKRWFKIPKFGTLQPSEFAKIAMIICIAIFLEKHKDDLNRLKTLALLGVLCAIPVLLIAIETDLSTSLDLTIILLAMIFVGGLSYKIIITVIAIFVPIIWGLLYYIDHAKNVILLKDYQVNRIKTFLHPSDDLSVDGALQQKNSVMAIGSGMLNGKQWDQASVTVSDANLVSEQQTDFIFSIIGERFGFIGCIIVIAFLLLIMLQCIRIARKAKNTSGMLIATGLASMICFQSFINIAVATQMLPNTGLPLPFLSYGLSSLLSLMTGIGIVLNVGLQKRKY